MELYEVGGCVRDEILGVKSKDIDYTVVLDKTDVGAAMFLGQHPFDYMVSYLSTLGYDIKVEKPEFLTIRAIFPKGHKHKGGADFVLARKEGTYTDGRRPDRVEVGTLHDDLARRDFTMNAIAKDKDGNYIDPFDGQKDIAYRIIRCVGDPNERIIKEDALRGMRALRFSVTKGFKIDADIQDILETRAFKDALSAIAIERISDELEKMFKVNTVDTLFLLDHFGLNRVLFSSGLRLMPTMKG